eukprot:g83482.t1
MTKVEETQTVMSQSSPLCCYVGCTRWSSENNKTAKKEWNDEEWYKRMTKVEETNSDESSPLCRYVGCTRWSSENTTTAKKRVEDEMKNGTKE